MIRIEKINTLNMAIAAVLILLVVFFWSARTILSPILVAWFLVLILSSLKEYHIANRLRNGILVILVIWIFVKAQSVFFPFIVSFVIAYLLHPVADYMVKKRISRPLAVSIIILVILGVLVLTGMLLIPGIIQEVVEFKNRVPGLLNRLTEFIQVNLSKILSMIRVDPSKVQQNWSEKITNIEKLFPNLYKSVLSVGSFLGQLINVVIIPIVTFHFLKDFEKIKQWALDFVPKRHRGNVHFLIWRMNRILGGYLRGQLIVCIIVGVLTGVGLAIFQVPFFIMLSLITGILNIIPYLGLYISLFFSLLSGFFTPQPMVTMIKVASVFLVVQSLEAYVISPKIVGSRVGLHPVAVMFSILIFAKFFGLWGLVVGVPAAASIKFFMDEWKRRRKWREMHAHKILHED